MICLTQYYHMMLWTHLIRVFGNVVISLFYSFCLCSQLRGVLRDNADSMTQWSATRRVLLDDDDQPILVFMCTDNRICIYFIYKMMLAAIMVAVVTESLVFLDK